MHRIFGIIGCVISSATLFTWGFIALYGNDFVLANVIAVAIALGLIVGVALALADRLTGRHLWHTIATAAFVGTVIVAISILRLEAYSYTNLAISTTIIGIGGVFSGVNGFFYWLSARAYTNLRLGGNPV